jgi:TatD DNase family protein
VNATQARSGPERVWIDSHCHVHDPKIPDGADAAIAAAIDSGVGRLVTVGCDRDTSEAAIAVAAAHEQVVATVGLHPHDASDGVDTIVDLLDTPGIVAVGEAGLDYYYEHSPRDAQRAAFAAQIQLAHERTLPLDLSFSGIVTFKNATDVQAAATICPLDRMLVETDSPYLAPAPHRGSVNRPAWVPHVGAFIADLRDVPVEAVATATTARAVELFGL